jgi:uncharacterized Zn-finger protein
VALGELTTDLTTTGQQVLDQFVNGDALPIGLGSIDEAADVIGSDWQCMTNGMTSMLHNQQNCNNQSIADILWPHFDSCSVRQDDTNYVCDQMPLDPKRSGLQQHWAMENNAVDPLSIPYDFSSQPPLVNLGDVTSDISSGEPLIGTNNASTMTIQAIPVAGQTSTGSARSQHTCSQCFKTFTRRSDLRRHARSHDANAQRFPCLFQGCGSDFPRNDKLQEHRRRLNH